MYKKQKLQYLKSFIAGTITAAGIYFVNANAFLPGESSGMPTGSPIAQSILQQTQDCAEGKAGTLGDAILRAIEAHTKIQTPPEVENLFDIGSDCFSGISKIYDLSGSIPSLGSIISSAQQLLMDYAKEKVCKAAQKVSGMVTDPLNENIRKINEEFKDISGYTMTTVPFVPNGGSGQSVRHSGSGTIYSGIEQNLIQPRNQTPNTNGSTQQPASTQGRDQTKSGSRYDGLSGVFK